MILPIRTDRRLERTPWINPLLIAVNVVVFVLTRERLSDPEVGRWMLSPMTPRVAQFVAYQFLHADFWHLAGNMLFLYIFGNAVEDRLGRAGYLFFYIAGGICAGLGHALLEHDPVLGASGSVAAVSGAFLALMPKSQVTLFYWFIFYIGVLEVSAMVVIGVYFAIDVFRLVSGETHVAYLAHLAGYAYGFIIGMALLGSGLLEREPYDMLALLKHRRRRQQFRSMTREGYRPWAHHHDAEQVDESEAPDPALVDARAAVSRAYAVGDVSGAASAYAKLLDKFPGQVLPKQTQLDVANQLMADQQHQRAAHAYELYLGVYPPDTARAEVELILALICVRYLDRKQRGRELLTEALPRLRDPAQAELARQMLSEIGE